MRVLPAWCVVLLMTHPVLGDAGRQVERRPSVVLILVDDMGYADLGCYGAEDIRTPHIDRLAREGVRLTDFYSNGPVCTPTRAALMTGRYQQRVGLEWALGPSAQPHRLVEGRWVPQTDSPGVGLPATETSLARMLKNAGYATAVFGKWHLGERPEYGPNAHGFDEFFGIHRGNADMYSHKNRDGAGDLFENTQPVQKEGYLTDLISDRAVEFVRRPRDRPFFLYVSYNAVHWPFQAPDRPGDVRTTDTWFHGTRRDYAAMLERMDRGVGRILEAVDQQAIARDTLVIFTNDNGGERLSSNLPFFHHKATLWEGGIRVPCLVRWPGRLPAGKLSHQPAITMDLTATVLAATGTPVAADRKLDGIDLLPTLSGHSPGAPLPGRTAAGAGARTDFADRPLCWRIDRNDRKQKAIRRGKWKYVLDGQIELLFDIEQDPGERSDLGYRYPARLAELRQQLAAWEADVNRSAPPLVVR